MGETGEQQVGWRNRTAARLQVLWSGAVTALQAAGGAVWSRRGLVAMVAAAVAAVALLMPEFLRSRYEAMRVHLFNRHDNDGLILLNSPQVFTRGRLVNDRAIEGVWLVRQLNRTDDLVRSERFGGPSSIELTQRKGSVGEGEKSAVKLDDDAIKQLAALGIKPKPLDQFREAAAYREEIRNRQLSTVLDDRHDIEGNTVYRLNFTATVVPSLGTDRLAAVVVELSEPRDHRPTAEDRLNERFVELMHDWSEKLELQLNQVVADRLFTSARGFGFSPQEADKFGDWLEQKIREKTGADPDQNIRHVSLLLRKKTEFSDSQAQAEMADAVREYLEGKEDGQKAAIIGSARKQCIDTNRIDPDKLPFKPTASKQSAEKAPDCPRALSGVSPLGGLVDLLDVARYAIEQAKAGGPIAECAKDAQTFFGLLEHAIVPSPPPPPASSTPSTPSSSEASVGQATNGCDKVGRDLFVSRQKSNPGLRQRAIVAEFYVKLTQEKEAKTNLDEVAGTVIKLGDLFDIRFPPNCVFGIGQCDPLVTPKKNDANSARKLLALQKALRARATVFTYAVEPNRNADPRQIATDDGLSVGIGKAAVSLGGAARSSSARLVQSPTIMGFGDFGSNARGSGPRASTKFGWVMFPRAETDWFSLKRHTPESYSVSAFISVPGWWKAARLNIDTCWVSEIDVVNTSDLGKVCRQNEKRPAYSSDIRLPGEMDSVMQNLRFEVIAYPHLSQRQNEAVVEVGREAKIVINGERLWRTPIVQLGSQQADSVEVLPDMRGIIAKFNCVFPSPGTAGQRMAPSTNGQGAGTSGPSPQEISPLIPLFVMTSEGMTTQMPVTAKPFTKRLGETEEKEPPCWIEKKKPADPSVAQNTVATATR